MSEEKVFLHWIRDGWDTPKMFRGVPCCVEFESLDKLKEVMSKHLYGGEWVTDAKGNTIDIDLNNICAKLERYEG